MDSNSEKYQLNKLAYHQSRITNHCTVNCNVTYQTTKTRKCRLPYVYIIDSQLVRTLGNRPKLLLCIFMYI